MEFIKVTKLTELEDALVPNNIPVGNNYYGRFMGEPEVGSSFLVGAVSAAPKFRGLTTSVVQEIMPDGCFRTYNSIYKVQEITQVEIAALLEHITRAEMPQL